ncbi:hypothetical protein GQ457_18G000590 [Hibiscus cannabinus]
MLNGGEDWDSRKVRHVFNESDANAVLECPINPIREDLQVWGPHSSWVYSVKSGYKWISSLQSLQEDRSTLWRTIAALPTFPKIRLFAWRLCYEAFPLGRKLTAAGLPQVYVACARNLWRLGYMRSNIALRLKKPLTSVI